MKITTKEQMYEALGVVIEHGKDSEKTPAMLMALIVELKEIKEVLAEIRDKMSPRRAGGPR